MSRVKKILIISYFFPPLNVIGSLRTYYWALEWAKEEIEVTILTSKKYAWMGNIDFPTSSHPKINIVEVEVFAGHWLSRLKGSKAFLKTSDKGNSRKANWLRSIKQCINMIRINFLRSFVEASILWHRAAVREGLKILNSSSFDIMLSTFSPATAHQVACQLKKKFPELFWVADFRDLWSSNPSFPKRGVLKWVEQFWEKQVICRANLLTTVSSVLSEELVKIHQLPVRVIYNGFWRNQQEIAIFTNKLKKQSIFNFPISIAYTGSIYGSRTPEQLFWALNELEQDNIIKEGDIYIDFYGNNSSVLQKIVTKTSAECWIRQHGYIPYHEIVQKQQNADFLLIIESSSGLHRGNLTGKIFEYLMSGTPILSIGTTIDHSIVNLLNSTQTGYNLGATTADIKSNLIILFQCRKNFFFDPNLSIIKTFSTACQAKELLSLLHTAVKDFRACNIREDICDLKKSIK